MYIHNMQKYIYPKFICGFCKQKRSGQGFDPHPLRIKDKICKACYQNEVQRIKVNIALGKMGLLEELNQLM